VIRGALLICFLALGQSPFTAPVTSNQNSTPTAPAVPPGPAPDAPGPPAPAAAAPEVPSAPSAPSAASAPGAPSEPNAPGAPGAPSTAREDFDTFLEGVRVDALALGISAPTVERALQDLEPSPTVIQRDQSQAEVVLTIDQYLERRLTRPLVRTARQMATKHRTLLARVAAQYGVPPRVLVAVWGLESNFGRFSGVRPTIQALATLAWEGRRGPFFRGELMNALQIVDRGYIGLEQLRGSWAGAMGQPQFMPSSYLQWAQDFDEDGDRDIWTSPGDIFASIANYLREHGWQAGTTWGREVKLPDGGIAPLREIAGTRAEGCRAAREMTTPLPLARWQAFGVRTAAGGPLPKAALDASLIGTGKRAFLVYGNYDAILGYNCAHSYALAVALLSDQIGA
jgi:membrane-bound lytic murein transglycosylase B